MVQHLSWAYPWAAAETQECIMHVADVELLVALYALAEQRLIPLRFDPPEEVIGTM